MNLYISDLLSTLNNRYSTESAGMTIGEWICANTTYRGRPFSFAQYRFQKQIADDMHPDLDVMKISQVGLSEIQIRKALAMLVRNPGRTGIFTFPDEIMYRRFSQQRLQPLVRENKVFNTERDSESVRSMAIMEFNRSFLNIVHAVEGSATSIAADFVFNDEVDLSDQKVLALFSSRLQNSDWKIKQRFSTPSWTGYGIDSTYSASDQHEYFARCSVCNHWQIPLFDPKWVRIPGLRKDIDLVDITTEILETCDLTGAYVACEHCDAALDLGDDRREWVPTFPKRIHARGYRVRPFTASTITVPYIITQLLSYRQKDNLRGWYNTVLGEPYVDAKARLDEAQIRACLGSPGVPELDSEAPLFLGIDMGQVCHAILATPGPEGVLRAVDFRAMRVQDIVPWVKELNDTRTLIQGVCDRHPYTPTAEELRDVTQGKVMPVEYRGSVELKPVKDIATDNITHWQADRTKLIDEAAKLIRTKKIVMEGYGHQSSVIIEHFRDMIRDESPETPAKWVKLNGNDHYFHALAFLQAATRLGSILDFVLDSDTRTGLFMANAGRPLVRNLAGIF